MDTTSDAPLPDVALAQKRALLTVLLQKKTGRSTSLALSFAQQRLWFLNQLAPNSPFYNVLCTITINGALQKAVLEQSLNELVRRHEALRTHFGLVEGRPVQLINPPGPLVLPIEDLTTLSASERTAEVRRLCRDEIRRPFDLAKGPLLRTQLLQIGAEEYIFLLSMHHIVSDGWSIGILFQELGALYAAFSRGQASPLPELPLQYADYARWQREWLTEHVLHEQLTYWRQKLAALPQLALPLDRPRPTTQSFAGASEPFSLAPETVAQLKALSQQEGATLFMTLLAGFSVLLFRYSGQEDIVIGTGIANRTRKEFEGLIGFFVNTLVLRTDLSGDPTVRALIRRAREVALGAYMHQDVPFEQLVEELHPHRNLNQNPLFQVILALQNAPYEPLDLAGLKLHLSLVQSGSTKFDIYLSLWESAGGLHGLAEYSTDLFEASTIRRMLGHYRQILTAMATSPDVRLSILALLTEAEYQQLQVWNATQTDYPHDMCLPRLFERQAQQTPHAVALCFEQEALTYEQLNQRANQLAHYLHASGVRVGDLVGLSMERSLDLIIGMLAIIKAGAAYVPLDLAYPQERVAFMIQDTCLQVLLTQRTLLERLPQLPIKMICLDQEREQFARQAITNLAWELPVNALAYIIYTSGSTGIPKGVMVSHQAIARLVLNTNYIQITAADRMGQVSNTSFDAATFEIWGALLHGAQLVGIGRDVLLSPMDFALTLREQGISTMFVTTALFHQLAQEIPDALRTLRVLLTGGETLTPKWMRTILERGRPTQLLHVYGPTENTTFSTYYLVDSVPVDASSVPIGSPIANSQAYILDRQLHLLPVGVPGELYVGGNGLALGYWQRADLTAERFVPHPYSQHPGERLYKTGDLVRRLPSGELEFLQRLDTQVKIRGFRVELGEIEFVLNRWPGVRESVVTVHEDQSGQKHLVAYIVPDTSTLRAQDQETAAALSHEHVIHWQMIFDDRYGQAVTPSDPTFHIVGWNSSMTGLPLPAQDMRTWLDDTISTIEALQPRRILEIGCGTGLLLFRLVPHCQFYHGTDISATSLTYLREQLNKPAYVLPQVSLSQCAADDFSNFDPESFDTVILNSVVQYFPDVNYLVHVLEGALRLLTPGGHIFLGDVRSLPLLEIFHTQLAFEQVPASLSLDQLQQRIRQQVQTEEELALDPAFFTRLAQVYPSISQIRVIPKRGRYINELSQFRYQVILRISGEYASQSSLACEWLDWQEAHLDLASLRALLEQQSPPALGLTGVPNARLTSMLCAHQFLTSKREAFRSVEELRGFVRTAPQDGVEPEDLWALGSELPYEVAISWARHDARGSFDVVFYRKEYNEERELASALRIASVFPVEDLPRRTWNDYANWPSRGSLSHHLLAQLRLHLRKQLPDYMIPSSWVPLERLPLTPNGKLDRQALPDPDRTRPERETISTPFHHPMEELLASVWAEVLGIEHIGVNDNFFDLGGHSLLATQVIVRVREMLGQDVPLRYLFTFPTVAGLAQALQAERWPTQLQMCSLPLEPQARPAWLPLSFAQERLWFLAQLEQAAPAYTMITAFLLKGPLQVEVLEKSLNALVRRHEALRTHFAVNDGVPTQVIDAPYPLRIPLVDLATLPTSTCQMAVQQLTTEEAQRSFHVAQGPLLHAQLLRLAAQKHVFLLAMHHIISDGWSLSIFLQELGTLYSAFSTQHASPLPDLPLQYTDYTLWHRQWLTQPLLQAQLAYWLPQLADLSPLALPTDYRRPAIQRFRGRNLRFHISPELTQALKQLSQREGVTLFMTLLAGFYVLLSRYSGQTDLAIGTPIAHRTHTKLEGLIGLFVNTLVLRTNLADDPDIQTLLDRVRQVTLDAYAHQDLPFEKLVEALNPQRNLTVNPLFQVMFALQNAPVSPLTLPGIQAYPHEIQEITAHFDLMLNLYDEPSGIRGEIEYDQDLFKEDTIQRLIEHYRQILRGMLAHPEQRMSALPFLTEAEQVQLRSWNAIRAEYPQDMCLHELFEQQAERTPDVVALMYDQEQLTYSELNRRAQQLAVHLKRLGVGPEVRVGICLERNVTLVIGVLAILKAGGAYIPLDPQYPKERLAFMLTDTQALLLVTQQCLLERLPQCDIPVLCLNTQIQTSVMEREEIPRTQLHSRNLAYIIYTSGSTGQPKGVAIEHQNAVALLYWAREVFTPEDLSGTLMSTSICFDLSIFELFAPLSWGGKVLLCEHALQLPTLYPAHHVTLVNTVPSAATALVRLHGIPSSVRTVNLAGEPLSPALVQRLYQASSILRVLNLYGPSEDTTYSTMALIEQDADTVSLGRPLPYEAVYVLDAHQQHVPLNIAGELYIGGKGVARGYLNRPELTAERFVPDPFSTILGARMYKTGDGGRYWPDGNLEFLGRLDTQIKLRGFRIELGEIETVLNRHPAVREVVVLAREDRPGDQQLVAYIVAEPGYGQTNADLRQYAKQYVPEYMLPSTFVWLDALPLTANGKVDRKALPQPNDEREKKDASVAPPQTPLEEIVADIWRHVLGKEQIGTHDNFFDLGGHSLLATQVVARMRKSLQREIPLRTLFEAPTIAELADWLAEDRQRAPQAAITPLQPMERPEALPLSFAQQRLWFLDQWQPRSPFYNIPAAFRVEGLLQVEVLQRSLDEIVRRHEALRTTFPLRDGQPMQLIGVAQRVALPLIDLAMLTLDERGDEAQRLAFTESQIPFDLSQGPLFRAVLLRLSAQEHLLLLTMHHIVTDGWSISVLLSELASLYTNFIDGQPSSLAPLSLQYADVTMWQRQWLQGEVLEIHLAYWRQRLAGMPSLLALPTDKPRPTVQTFRGAQVSFLVPEVLTTALKALSRREGVTLFMVLLAAFQVLLMRYSGQEDVVVGTPIAHRTHSQLEGLIGFFANTLLLRSNLTGNPTFGELLQHVRMVTLEAYAHQDLPFERLVEELQPERVLSHAPLFQVMFTLQNVPLPKVHFPDLIVTPFAVKSGTSRLDLTVVLAETEHGFMGEVEYNTDLFEAATIAHLIEHYQTLLTSLAGNSQQRLWSIPLVTEREQEQLRDWNATQRSYPEPIILQCVIERQVERTPDAIAVSLAEVQLSYAELNRCANTLAQILRGLGVKEDSAVGICLERSPELFIGLLGILKAGGAYVPLDPSYPHERLSYMLTGACVQVVLTQERFLANIPQSEARVVCLEEMWRRIINEVSANPVENTLPEQLAYITYTSGSTGRPKGVMISHRSICNRLWWMQEAYPLQPADRVLQKTPLSFDVSVWECFWPLLTGAQVVLARPRGQQESAYLVQVIREQSISILHFVPSMLSVFLQEEGLEQCRSLKRAICSGEALSSEVQERFFERMEAELCNLYGPTEAAVDVTAWTCTRSGPLSNVPIGRPIANLEMYVLDHVGNVVPIGVPGELHIGGVGLARGYVQHPELTAERFVPHPTSLIPGARLYKTGDLVRYRRDGNLEFLERIDHQVKLRGFRIELGEIEILLKQFPGVQQALVLLRENASLGKYLVAYLVPTQLASLSIADVRHFLQTHLPSYMIPAQFVLMEAFPVTPHGKLDRRALPAPEMVGQQSEEGLVEPQTEMERAIAQIWQEILGRQHVSLHHNFFELGGHSLLMIQVHRKLQERLGLDLTLVDLFTYPTIRSLVHYLHMRESAEPPPQLVTTRGQKRTELLQRQQRYRQAKG